MLAQFWLWQVSLAGPLVVLGVMTTRAGWLGARGRLRPPRQVGATARDEAAFTAAAKVSGPPLLVAGGIALLGAAVAVLQRDMGTLLMVTTVTGAGAFGLALVTRPLADRAAATVLARPAACAGCPVGSRGESCCAAR